MRQFHRLASLALSTLAVAACQTARAATRAHENKAAVADGGLRTIPISGPRDGMELVVRDSVHWRVLWPSLADVPENVRPIEPVDFMRDVVVIIALGQRGGTDFVKLDSVARHSDITVVYYRTSVRVATCMKSGGPGMYSTPAIAFRLQRPPGPVLFERRVGEPPC